MRPLSTHLLALALVFGAGAFPSDSQTQTIAVPRGFTVKVVTFGLDGPEGLGLGPDGQIAVCEAIDAAPEPLFSGPGRLTLVRPNGRKRTLATEEGLIWLDVARDPARGYFVTTLGGFGAPPIVRGIRRVLPNGEVSVFLPATDHMTGIALDRRTGDLYVSRVAPNPTSIDRVTPDGTRSVFAAAVRPEGLAIALGRKLIATIQRRPTSSSPLVNQVVSLRLGTGAETVLANGVGTLIGAVAVSETGEIFVSDHKDGKIRRLRPDGAGGYRLSVFASGFSTSSRRYPPDLAPYFGLSFNHLVFGSRGRLYVSDYGAGRIYAIEGPF